MKKLIISVKKKNCTKIESKMKGTIYINGSFTQNWIKFQYFDIIINIKISSNNLPDTIMTIFSDPFMISD